MSDDWDTEAGDVEDGWGEADGNWEGGDDGWGAQQQEEVELTPFNQLENAYTEAEYATDEESKLLAFQNVLAMAELVDQVESSEITEAYNYLFKSHVAIVTIYFRWPDYNSACTSYSELLDLVPKVSRTDASNGIEQVLVAAAAADFDTFDYTYQLTRDKLSHPDYARMMHKFNMKQCYDLYSSNEYDRTLACLEAVHDKCRLADGSDDQKQFPSELIEIYALKVKIAIANESVNLKEMYRATKDLSAPVKNPASQAVLEECWGRFLAGEGSWKQAYDHFEHAFMDYQTCREQDKAKQSLKYLILANILLGGKMNPFNSQESKQFQQDDEILVFKTLRQAFDKNDVTKFSRCVRQLNAQNDKFLLHHLTAMIWDFHSKSILSIVESYKKIKMSHLAQHLEIDEARCQKLVVSLILDGKLFGKINQVKGLLDLSGGAGSSGSNYHQNMDSWTDVMAGFDFPTPAGGSSGFSKRRGGGGGMSSWMGDFF